MERNTTTEYPTTTTLEETDPATTMDPWYHTTDPPPTYTYDTTESDDYQTPYYWEPWSWEINHIIIIMAFIAVNVIPITLLVWCLTRNCKRYLPSCLNVYFVGAVLMLSAFTITVYVLATVDFEGDSGDEDDRLILRDYIASLAITEFFVAFGCLFGICKHNYRESRGRRNSNNSRNNSNTNTNENELPLPSYEDALNNKVYPKKKTKKTNKRSSNNNQDVESATGDGDNVSIASSTLSDTSSVNSTEELPSFGQALHM